MVWKHLMWIALGGGLGSVLRFLVQKYSGSWPGQELPTGTLLVNIAGCLLIGIFYDLSSRIPSFDPALRLLLMTGFCGGFTTFSAFTLENMELIHQQRVFAALVYTGVSVLGGGVSTFMGYWLSRNLFN